MNNQENAKNNHANPAPEQPPVKTSLDINETKSERNIKQAQLIKKNNKKITKNNFC
ncbi:hypothetical protein [Spiroplasma mirum]|uniref:hypothetical protein n=1 Tax=Spiroplasma mirum TaxID=2144 RepID=UPI0004BB2389|nr:hypothetical protein [Spiroplasma atrichopogonis]